MSIDQHVGVSVARIGLFAPAACRRALAFEHLQYRGVKTILENGLDAIEDDEPAFDRLSDAYLGGGRFCRDLKNLLIH